MSSVEEMYNGLSRAVKLGGGFTARMTAQRIDGTMGPGEAPRGLGIGTTDGKRAFIVVTNRRVIVEKIGPLGKTIEVPLQAVTGFSVSGAVGTIQLRGAGVSVQVRSVGQPIAGQLAAAARQGRDVPALRGTPAAEPVSSTSGDAAQRLRQIAELHDAGILTPEEFEAKKAELLKQL